jgi:hypothetical protein
MAYLPPISAQCAINVPNSGLWYDYFTIDAQGFADRLIYALDNNYPFDVYQIDAGWADYFGDYNMHPELLNFLGTGKTVIKWIKDTGLVYGRIIHPGGYMLPGPDARSAFCAAHGTGAPYLTAEGVYNPNTPEGRAAVIAVCNKLLSYGFEYARIDGMRANAADSMALAKIICDTFKESNPDFVIESHGSINAAFLDTCRTQDFFGYPADWQQSKASAYRMVAMTAPNRIVDTDGFPGNGALANAPLGNTGIYEQEIDLLLGYGRPIIYFLPYCWPTPPDDPDYETTVNADLKAAEPYYLSRLNAYATLPREVPSRRMTGEWDTELIYSNGSKIIGSLTSAPVFSLVNFSVDSILPITTTSTTLTGTMQSGCTVQGVSGATFGVISYPTSTTWSIAVSGLSLGNNMITVEALDATSAVVGTASTVVIYATVSSGTGLFTTNNLLSSAGEIQGKGVAPGFGAIIGVLSVSSQATIGGVGLTVSQGLGSLVGAYSSSSSGIFTAAGLSLGSGSLSGVVGNSVATPWSGTGVTGGAGSLAGSTVSSSTAQALGVGITLGSGAFISSQVAAIAGVGIGVGITANQIRAPNGTVRVLRNIHGAIVNFNR